MVCSILILGADRNVLFPLPARGSLFFPIRGLGSGEADASLFRLSEKRGVWSRTNPEREFILKVILAFLSQELRP